MSRSEAIRTSLIASADRLRRRSGDRDAPCEAGSKIEERGAAVRID
jgi:hypothetical protein